MVAKMRETPDGQLATVEAVKIRMERLGQYGGLYAKRLDVLRCRLAELKGEPMPVVTEAQKGRREYDLAYMLASKKDVFGTII